MTQPFYFSVIIYSRHPHKVVHRNLQTSFAIAKTGANSSIYPTSD